MGGDYARAQEIQTENSSKSLKKLGFIKLYGSGLLVGAGKREYTPRERASDRATAS